MKDQDQQAAGYHRSKGPGSVGRKYTLQEQAQTVRIFEAVCRAIRKGEFNPDRPAGAEYDQPCTVRTPEWTTRDPENERPVVGHTADDKRECEIWTSDDEALGERTSANKSKDEAQDMIDQSTARGRHKTSTKCKGDISANTKKGKHMRHHRAIIWEEAPQHIRGCADKDKRASTTGGGTTSHVLCDTRVPSAQFTISSRMRIQAGCTLCKMCGSRRRRWRLQDASTRAAKQPDAECLL